MSLITSILTGGANNHETTSEEANFVHTDFIENEGIVGAITDTAGVAPMTGGFAVNAQGTPDMTVAVSAGAAYVTGTPTGQNSQMFRVRNTASANVTISANSTGGTRYDWIYIALDADNAANPAADGSDVASLVTSRSTSSSSDDGTPPTYGYNIAVVTVANGASSITNGNIAEARQQTFTAPTNGFPTRHIADDAVTDAKRSRMLFADLSAGNKSVTSLTDTPLDFDTTNYDPEGWGDVGGSNPERVTVDEAGVYLFVGNVTIAHSAEAGASDTNRAFIKVNGSSTVATTIMSFATDQSYNGTYNVSGMAILAANDYLTLNVLHRHGTDTDCSGRIAVVKLSD